MTEEPQIRLDHFSDVLCVWAYVSQARIDELRESYGARMTIRYHFIPIFGDPAHRIGVGWTDRGGFEGYAEHVAEICRDFPHVQLNAHVWREIVPRSSGAPHHFLKAVQLLEDDGVLPATGSRSVLEEAAWRVRLAFFRDGIDVSRMDRLLPLADELGVPSEALAEVMGSGAAMAAACRDAELRDELRIEGSPTYVLNDGRQKLYGNVGYNVIRANVEEIGRQPRSQASWC